MGSFLLTVQKLKAIHFPLKTACIASARLGDYILSKDGFLNTSKLKLRTLKRGSQGPNEYMPSQRVNTWLCVLRLFFSPRSLAPAPAPRPAPSPAPNGLPASGSSSTARLWRLSHSHSWSRGSAASNWSELPCSRIVCGVAHTTCLNSRPSPASPTLAAHATHHHPLPPHILQPNHGAGAPCAPPAVRRHPLALWAVLPAVSPTSPLPPSGLESQWLLEASLALSPPPGQSTSQLPQPPGHCSSLSLASLHRNDQDGGHDHQHPHVLLPTGSALGCQPRGRSRPGGSHGGEGPFHASRAPRHRSGSERGRPGSPCQEHSGRCWPFKRRQLPLGTLKAHFIHELSP